MDPPQDTSGTEAPSERIRVLVRVRPLEVGGGGGGGGGSGAKKARPKRKARAKRGRPKKKVSGGVKGAAGKKKKVVRRGGKRSGKKVSATGRKPRVKASSGGRKAEWTIPDAATIRDDGRQPPAEYRFDRVYGPRTVTEDLYRESVQTLVFDAMSGINATVFAYGQTGSGKTHSILGTPDDPGVIRLLANDLWTGDGPPLTLTVSYLECYNEQLHDLLAKAPKKKKKKGAAGGEGAGAKLAVISDPTEGVTIPGLTTHPVGCADDILALLKRGEKRRHYRSTLANKKSSRSHTLFRLRILSESPDGTVTVSVLTVIDLAGSESVKTSGTSGSGRGEGANINKSLLSLSRIIEMLSRGVEGHIPFRDSKLTRILEPSLVGNGRISVICTLNPAPTKAKESHSTLNFARNAKKVKKGAVTRNEIVPSFDNEELLRMYRQQMSELQRLRLENEEYKAEIERLRARLAEEEVNAMETSGSQEAIKVAMAQLQERTASSGTGSGGRRRQQQRGSPARSHAPPAGPSLAEVEPTNEVEAIAKEILMLKNELRGKERASPFHGPSRKSAAAAGGGGDGDGEYSYYSSDESSSYEYEYSDFDGEGTAAGVGASGVAGAATATTATATTDDEFVDGDDSDLLYSDYDDEGEGEGYTDDEFDDDGEFLSGDDYYSDVDDY